MVDQTQKKAAPLFKKSPAGKDQHIGDYVVETINARCPRNILRQDVCQWW